jgi:hypothetical protein
LPRPDFTRAQLPKPEPAPGDRATVFVPASNSSYPALLEWSMRTDTDPQLFKFEARPGIWVSYDTWENRRVATMPRTEASMPRIELSAEAKRVMASVDAERNGTLPADVSRETPADQAAE